MIPFRAFKEVFMLKDYLIVERSALPDYFLRVVEARKLLESGACGHFAKHLLQIPR